MKILYLMTEPFGIGGVQSDLLTLSDDLTKRGHTVYVATTPGVLLDEVKAKGAIHVNIDFGFKGFAGLFKAAAAMRRVIREEGIELVAPQSVRSTISAFFALRLWPFGYRVKGTGKRVPIVTTIHNIHNPKNFKWSGRILQNCADHVIFESHYERNRLMVHGLKAANSEVIHSGVDTSRFVPQPRNEPLAERYGLVAGKHQVFGIVARLSEEKGHNYLVDAFAKVSAGNPDARLMIIGEGPLLEDVKQQVAKSGVADRIIFTGMQRDIPSYLSLLDVFVLSSTRESFPLAAREAMAGGKPVILPRIGGCPEVVEEDVTGYLFESANVDSLAAAMNRILEDRRYEGFGHAARARVERLFSRHSWVDGDEKVYLAFAR